MHEATFNDPTGQRVSTAFSNATSRWRLRDLGNAVSSFQCRAACQIISLEYSRRNLRTELRETPAAEGGVTSIPAQEVCRDSTNPGFGPRW
jgi:hypothetical protein